MMQVAESAVPARLIVCERTGRWAVALRRELAEAGVRVWETRTLADCWTELAESPASFLVLELGADVADLPERLHLASQAAAHPRRVDETIVLDEYLGRVERELIRRALARAKGNKARAARLLGMTRPRLYRRMVQLGLE
jgi:transcriptional regulator with GAF, ATPase, and Fis domain